jgi:pimeloyl-ACP methyl ester carboxylesterase
VTIIELEAHRRTVTTPQGPVSCIHVGSGPVALFVHGLGTNALLWRHVIRAFAGERRCVAIDLPLHGRTPAAAGQDFSLGALAEVVEGVCQAAGLRSVGLVAHDTGGAVSQVFAARHGDRLRSLCLTNCDAHDNVPPEAFRPTVDLAASGALAAGAAALLADPEAARALVFGSGYEDVTRLDLELARSFLDPVLGTPERARQFERFILSLRPDDLLAAEPRLAQLTVPHPDRLGHPGHVLRSVLCLLAQEPDPRRQRGDRDRRRPPVLPRGAPRRSYRRAPKALGPVNVSWTDRRGSS